VKTAAERPMSDRGAIGTPTYVIAGSITALKLWSVGAAVMEPDMTGVPVTLFRHAGHCRVNLVYRRADGHVGWIAPPTLEQDAH
jgi:hypothetical protein